MFENIDEAIEWIINRRNNNYSFDHFKKVCQSLNNPQDNFSQIHVAGTNGKGSTVTFLMSLISSAGYKVGTFVSPHYIKHTDRIRINNENISDEDFLRLLNNKYDFIIENNLSMFEIDYLIMCDYFIENKVNYAIIEVGLGGRLDSTNVVNKPLLSIITTIGFDHMERLGNTLPLICKEKCGIIKDNCPTLIGHLDSECVDVVKDICKKRNSKLYELGEYRSIDINSFEYESDTYYLKSLAEYQHHNASLAIKAFKILFDDKKVNKEALLSSLWHCRFEIVKENPRVILDGGHNIAGINALVKSFDKLNGSKCIIFSALKRKEYTSMIEILNMHCDKLVITTFDNNEVIDLDEFKDYEVNKDYREAINSAIKNYDNILICGSLYFMSDIALNYKFNYN